jgi:hypothetical protein
MHGGRDSIYLDMVEKLTTSCGLWKDTAGFITKAFEKKTTGTV